MRTLAAKCSFSTHELLGTTYIKNNTRKKTIWSCNSA